MACTSAMQPGVVRCSRSRARAVSHRTSCAGTMAMRRCSCPAPVCALTPPARRPTEHPANRSRRPSELPAASRVGRVDRRATSPRCGLGWRTGGWWRRPGCRPCTQQPRSDLLNEDAGRLGREVTAQRVGLGRGPESAAHRPCRVTERSPAWRPDRLPRAPRTGAAPAGPGADHAAAPAATDGDHRVAGHGSPDVRGVWVPETLRTLCDVLILVDQSAEPVASSDVVDCGWGAAGEGP